MKRLYGNEFIRIINGESRLESSMMKARFFIVFLLSLIASVCFAQGAASVIFASGNAQIVGKDGRHRAAVRGAEVVVGETVETADGRVQLRFSDGANMSLQPDTRFRIDEFRLVEKSGKASSDDRSFFSLLKGGFRTITGLIGKLRREQYKVDAVVATIGIRGTDYSAQLSESGLTVSTFGGLVEVCTDAGCSQVAPGETVHVTDRKSKPRNEERGTGGALNVPATPALPPPKPIEVLPAVTPPAQTPIQAPSTAPSMPGPSYSIPMTRP